MKISGFAFGLLLFTACGGGDGAEEQKELLIRLTPDSAAVRITGLPHEAFLELESPDDSLAWANSFPVYEQTGNPDLVGLEPLYPGKYLTKGDTLWFKPDSGFRKGRKYRVDIGIPEYYSAPEAVTKNALPGRKGSKKVVFAF